MAEQVDQQVCITFCIKLEHYSAETIWMIQKYIAMGNWWLEALSWQHACSCVTSHAVFGKTSNHPGHSANPHSPDWSPCDFCFFPKLKSPLKRKRFQTINEIQGNTMGSWCWLGELCEVPRCLLLWELSCHCPMYNVSVSCIFFNNCLYFSYYMARYFLDRSSISYVRWVTQYHIVLSFWNI